MTTFRKLEDIIAWQKTRSFCKELKTIFPFFIAAREFELLNKIKRSSGSIMDNIAEGFGRMGNAEFRNFLTISHGSILEVISQLYRAYDYDIILEENFKKFKGLAEEIDKIVFSLFNHLLETNLKGIKFKNR